VKTILPIHHSCHVNQSEILYGVENAVGRGVYYMSNVKQKMDIFFVDELRHLDGVRGGIAINESEYMANTYCRKQNLSLRLSTVM
jgi:two-component system, OmpR family, sensor histidine kinase VicK